MILLRLILLLTALGAGSAAYNLIDEGQWMGAILLASFALLFGWLAWLLGDGNGEIEPERHPHEAIFKMVYVHYGFALFASCSPSLDIRWFSAGMGIWLLYLIYMVYHFKIKKSFMEPETIKQIQIRTWGLFAVFSAFLPIRVFGVWGDWQLGGWSVIFVLAAFYWYFRKNPSKALHVLQNGKIIMRFVIPAGVIAGLSKSLIHAQYFPLGWQLASVFFLLFALFFILISQAVRAGYLGLEWKRMMKRKKKPVKKRIKG